MTFDGFPAAAFDFYDDLEMDNTKSFWEAHKATYDAAVRRPMTELTGALAAEFGPAKVFRPYRDVRFAKDKTPYKTHQGAFVGLAPATGWYAEISPAGFRVGGGFYAASSADLARIRRAIDDQRLGSTLEGMLATLTGAGFEVGGDKLKTSPRDWPADHPRNDLLRHKSLFVGRSYGFDDVIDRPDLVERVRADWRTLRPLVEWVAGQIA